MGMMGRTVRGYDFFECSSAFQKSIRRGDEDNAMFFGVELFNSGYGEYVWKRLKIITSEDVGLAEPLMPANIQALYQSYVEQVKKKDEKNRPERLQITHAILLLCRAKKSRLIDWTLIAYWNVHNIEHPRQIPDYAFDKHTQKGRSLGRGIEHFYEIGSVLDNMEIQKGEKEMKEKALKSEQTKKDLFE